MTVPGWRVGPDDNPDDYTLVEHAKDGGEGALWHASHPGRGRTQHWAVKIYLPADLEMSSPHPAETEKALIRQRDRWEQSARDVSQLRIADLLTPYRVFVGQAPHPPGQRASGRALYQVSPWVQGKDLRTWTGTPASAADALIRLCRIVHEMHDHMYVHRDISPANVMVGDDGRVTLIDVNSVNDSDLTQSMQYVTPGSAAPEVVFGRGRATFASDRYAVGVIATRLLSGAKRLPDNSGPEEADRALSKQGWSPPLRAHIARMLAYDPDHRPKDLLAWAEELQRMVRAESGRVLCVDVARSADNKPFVLFGSMNGVFGRAWDGDAPDVHFGGLPAAVRSVAADQDGHGDSVMFAVDVEGGLWLRRRYAWGATGVRTSGGANANRLPNGRVECLFVQDERLYGLETFAQQDEEPRRSLISEMPGLASGSPEVLSIAAVPRQQVALLRTADALHSIDKSTGEIYRIWSGPVTSATVAENRWSDFDVLFASHGLLYRSEMLSTEWSLPEELPVPATTTEVAFANHRNGRIIAAGGPTGLFVRNEDNDGQGDWTRLSAEPCTQVVLKPTHGFYFQLAALLNGAPARFVEDAYGSWLAP